MRILAVDYGERRTGIAVTDDLGITAQGLETLVVTSEDEIPARLTEIAKNLNAGRIVLGLPLNMDGTESEKSAKVRALGQILGSTVPAEIVYWDERMTTLIAHRVLRETGTKARCNKGVVDRISATLILQEYLTTIP